MSMDELMSAVSNTMHVGQHGQDLRALQDMLSQSISVPQQSTNGYLPPSRSTSVTRSSQPMTTPLGYEQPFPSPALNGFAESIRPGIRSRQRSYGFPRTSYSEESDSMSGGAGPSTPSRGWQAFDNDAFSAEYHQHLQQQSQAQAQEQDLDPWARIRQPQQSAFSQQYHIPQETNAWSAFQKPSTATGFGFGYQPPQQPQQYQQRFGTGRMPTPPDEDEEIDMDDDMDMSDDEDEDDFDQDNRAGQRASGFGGGGMEDKRAFSLTQLDHDQQAAAVALWQRGRRKT